MFPPARHPGGKVIEYYLKGEDSTDCYEAFHYRSKRASKMLASLPRLDNVEVPKSPKIAEDFRVLKKEWEDKGYFEPNLAVAVYKWIEIFVMVAAALYVAPMNWFVGGITVGFAWTRTGWIQHDSGHIAFSGIPSVDLKIQMFFEGFIKGGSGAWWRNRHNKHHAKPNVHKFVSTRTRRTRARMPPRSHMLSSRSASPSVSCLSLSPFAHTLLST
jgi:hypothetical protein